VHGPSGAFNRRSGYFGHGRGQATAEGLPHARCRSDAHRRRGGLPARWLILWLEQRQWVEIKSAGDALQALERQVALASLDAAHVGAVNAEYVGKRLLAESFGFSIGAQGSANGAL